MMENYQIDINKENKKTDDIYNIATEILKNAHRIAKVQTSSKDKRREYTSFYAKMSTTLLCAQFLPIIFEILHIFGKNVNIKDVITTFSRLYIKF